MTVENSFFFIIGWEGEKEEGERETKATKNVNLQYEETLYSFLTASLPFSPILLN
jgi:hypothetical protein